MWAAGSALAAVAFVAPPRALRSGHTCRPTRELAPTAFMRLDGGDADDTNRDWSEAMQQLRKRTEQADAPPAPEEQADPPFAPLAGSPPAQGPEPGRAAAESPPPQSAFRFESTDETKYVAGLDRRDEQLLRTATLVGGRLLTLITISSLAFYIYVGVTGGITDGFDRFTEPIEDIRETMRNQEGGFGGPDVEGMRAVDGLFRVDLIPP
jgi:hypothetical protein